MDLYFVLIGSSHSELGRLICERRLGNTCDVNEALWLILNTDVKPTAEAWKSN